MGPLRQMVRSGPFLLWEPAQTWVPVQPLPTSHRRVKPEPEVTCGHGAREALATPCPSVGAGQQPQSVQRLPKKTHKHKQRQAMHKGTPSVSEPVLDNICSEPKPPRPSWLQPRCQAQGVGGVSRGTPSVPSAHRQEDPPSLTLHVYKGLTAPWTQKPVHMR